MASIGTFFILLILFFLIFPVIKLGWKIYMAQKTAKKAFSEFHKQQQRQRRKTMGEYVDFEEVTDAHQASQQNSKSSKKSRIKDEPLITDAEWEEI